MTGEEIPMDETQIVENKETVIITNLKKIKELQKEFVDIILSKFDGLYSFNTYYPVFKIYKKIGFLGNLFGGQEELVFEISFDELSDIRINLYNESYLEELKKVLGDIEIERKEIIIE